jgi:hypothetical protein
MDGVIQNPIALSTWSVHNLLGVMYDSGPGSSDPHVSQPIFGPGKLPLAGLPAEMARRKISRAEICHFHLASRDPVYLDEIGASFQEKGIEIQTLLIDDGDLTNVATRQRDLDWMMGWIDAAARLGAKHARVIAGKSRPTPEALALSVDALKALARRGKFLGVRVVTENWFDLLASPREVHHVLDALDGEVGFLADTGNWKGPQKYENLRSVFARAELCHAKCHFTDGMVMESDDYRNCLLAARAGNYSGPFTLIFESPGDEWRGIEMERDFVQAFLATKH